MFKKVIVVGIVFVLLASLATAATTAAGQDDPATPMIHVDPASALRDTPVQIVLVGFEPGVEVTLQARATDSLGVGWESWATFVADESGSVDVSAQAPTAGSYTGVDGMGLFWSMTAANYTVPFSWDTLDPLVIHLFARVAGETVARAEIERLYVAQDVTRVEVREAGLYGTLFLPPGDGPFPALLVLGGSEGGLGENQAALLASHGYAALALAYFGYEDLPPELAEIPLEYCATALDWLRAHDAVDAGRIGIMGGSKGAELALLLAVRHSDVRAVVATAPASAVFQGLNSDMMTRPTSSWSEGGAPLPFVPFPMTLEVYQAMQTDDGLMQFLPVYEAALDDEAAVAEAAIPVEQIAGAILLVSGGDDVMSASERMADQIVARREANGQTTLHLNYPAAGHMIGVPYTPAMNTDRAIAVQGGAVFGGTPEANAAASADAWPRILAFLDENLR
ncbi:MAG: alpha/beta hydrolase fold domain-containing protein [Chloroflexi bacterium]|nr:alpha/beta hydrolase fold domain-containing protein [Chloroflexota bacterium]